MSNEMLESMLLTSKDVPEKYLELVNARIRLAYAVGHREGYLEAAGPKVMQPDPPVMLTPEDNSSYRPAGTTPLKF